MFKKLSNFAEDHPKPFRLCAVFAGASAGLAMMSLGQVLYPIVPIFGLLTLVGFTAFAVSVACGMAFAAFDLGQALSEEHEDHQYQRRLKKATKAREQALA